MTIPTQRSLQSFKPIQPRPKLAYNYLTLAESQLARLMTLSGLGTAHWAGVCAASAAALLAHVGDNSESPAGPRPVLQRQRICIGGTERRQLALSHGLTDCKSLKVDINSDVRALRTKASAQVLASCASLLPLCSVRLQLVAVTDPARRLRTRPVLPAAAARPSQWSASAWRRWYSDASPSSTLCEAGTATAHGLHAVRLDVHRGNTRRSHLRRHQCDAD